ncbi:DNA cytosine methyltransferase [Pseudomonas savastanoi]|uniref:DNA cytosine methyltransferase n=1 Tax=Pseudomonas savastanoi TaxID=29438 RepID=UPI001F39B849|nr:DNA cytosine methyltransferase [Pseudomonas savastanoi]
MFIPQQARDRIDGWIAHANSQAACMENCDKVVLSLFDTSGEWSRPWEEAGYQVYRFDIQDNPDLGDVNNFNVEFFTEWFADFYGQDVFAILAACPCTDFARSGCRDFRSKDLDGRTMASVELVHQTIRVVEYFKPALWAIENPVGRIEKLGGLPSWRLSFDPCHVGDPYTKKTLIWGRFNADLPVAPVVPIEGSKMHLKYGGRSLATKNARSITPVGFSYAFFMANNHLDNPQFVLCAKYDRLSSRLLGQAIAAGLKPREISELIDDAYLMDLDDHSAHTLLREAVLMRGSNLDSFVDRGGQVAMCF